MSSPCFGGLLWVCLIKNNLTESKEPNTSTMKKNFLFVLLILGLGFTSCNKKCNCTDDYDANITYVKGDLVKYDGKCWKADAQGKNITPGPWLQNGNDIWQECAK